MPPKPIPVVAPRRDAPPTLVPSPVFGLLVGAFAFSGWALASGDLPPNATLCAFGLTGWLISLCLHEFGHALAAYRLGDRSVAGKGYLTLNPLRYADPVTSLLLPLIFLAIGGFALPGGCVYIETRALRGRHAAAIVSAAGPAANLTLLLAIAAAYPLLPSAEDGGLPLQAGLQLVAYLQAFALVLNLLPIPGFDGYGILRPYLPADLRARVDGSAGGAWLILLAALWFVPGVARALFRFVNGLVDAVGLSGKFGSAALDAALFWL